jgi:hypothetical protein
MKRGLFAVIALVIAGAVVIGGIQTRTSRGFLDPDGVDARGSRALARLLEQHGVTIREVRTTADVVDRASARDTVLITNPDLLTAHQIDRIVDTGARLVLIAPQTTVAEFVPQLHAVSIDSPRTVEPGCADDVAHRAGSARLGSYGYRGTATLQGARCYLVGGEPTLVITPGVGTGMVTIVGCADPFTNEYLDQDGNAALTAGLLGTSQRLTWYRPIPEQTDAGTSSLTAHLPGWVTAAVWQLAIAGGLAAVWRARRLGGLVTEPLPVVVRARETTEGRARLYRRGRARGHAAVLLREAARQRLTVAANLPRTQAADDTSNATLAAALARRTGRPPAEISALLAGPPPHDDAGLVRLANDLDQLERETRTP